MNQTIDTINQLRTIHGEFSDKEIDSEELKLILNASVQAANASARQSYSIIVVEEKKMMKKLCGYEASKLLLYCVDYNRLTDLAGYLGHQFDRKDLTGFITGSTDTILAAQTAAIAAKSLGIDSLFTNGIHRGEPERVIELLDLPEEQCFPLIALLLGYPVNEPETKTARIIEGIIHYGKYSHLSDKELEQLVNKYDLPDEHLSFGVNWKKEFRHYLDWFFTRWSAKSDTKPLRKLFEKTGFLQ